MKKQKTITINGKPVAVKHDSNSFSIGWKDGLRALLLAVISPVLLVIQQSMTAGNLQLNWKTLLATGLSAGIGYLLKNYFTPGEIVLDKKTL